MRTIRRILESRCSEISYNDTPSILQPPPSAGCMFLLPFSLRPSVLSRDPGMSAHGDQSISKVDRQSCQFAATFFKSMLSLERAEYCLVRSCADRLDMIVEESSRSSVISSTDFREASFSSSSSPLKTTRSSEKPFAQATSWCSRAVTDFTIPTDRRAFNFR